MRDEELHHSEKSRLEKDQRDDRRDTVTGDVGSLGFTGFEEDDQRVDESERTEETIDPAVGNDVESFQEDYAEDGEVVDTYVEGEERDTGTRQTLDDVESSDVVEAEGTGATGDYPARPMPEGSDFRSNRETAKNVDVPESEYTEDQVTPPTDEYFEQDGGDPSKNPAPERNEPERDH